MVIVKRSILEDTGLTLPAVVSMGVFSFPLSIGDRGSGNAMRSISDRAASYCLRKVTQVHLLHPQCVKNTW